MGKGSGWGSKVQGQESLLVVFQPLDFLGNLCAESMRLSSVTQESLGSLAGHGICLTFSRQKSHLPSPQGNQVREVGRVYPPNTPNIHFADSMLKSKVQNSHGCGCVTRVMTILQRESKLPEYLSMLSSNSFVYEILGVTTEEVLVHGPMADFQQERAPSKASHEMSGPGRRLHISKTQLVLCLEWQHGGEEPPQLSFGLPANSLEQSTAVLHLHFSLCSERVDLCPPPHACSPEKPLWAAMSLTADGAGELALSPTEP